MNSSAFAAPVLALHNNTLLSRRKEEGRREERERRGEETGQEEKQLPDPSQCGVERGGFGWESSRDWSDLKFDTGSSFL